MSKGLLKFSILVGILLLGQLLYSQDYIRLKTMTIVDSSKSKVEQVREIYDWVCSNIRYDVKSYLKGSSSNKSAIETLKRRKGICYDYAELFMEMCKSINIKSYLVRGYAKGEDYYPGTGFYRSNHCWNAVNIDSSWFLVDATWGSGYLEKKAEWMDRMKHSFFKIPYVNKKLIFIPKPSEKYLNLSYDSLRQTHMPLDPVWQITDMPYTITSFESDSNNQRVLLRGNKSKLRKLSIFSENQEIFDEAQRGKEFNVKNNFDLAKAYLLKAESYEFNPHENDSSGLAFLRESLENYLKSIEYIKIQKNYVDSIYKLRLAAIKLHIKEGKNTENKLIAEYKSERKNFKKKQESLSNRFEGLLQRINQYEAKITNLEEDSIFDTGKFRLSNADTMALNNNNRNLNLSLKSCENSRQEIDSAIERCSKLFGSDSLYSLYLNQQYKSFLMKLTDFGKKLSTEDNLRISNAWTSLYKQFHSLKDLVKLRSQNLTKVQENYSNLIMNLSLLVSRYQNQSELIINYYKYTGDSVSAGNFYRQTKLHQIEANGKAKNLIFDYRDLTGKLYGFNSQSFAMHTLILNPAEMNISLFVKFEEQVLSEQKLAYKNERDLIKAITDRAGKGYQKTSRFIDKYYAAANNAGRS